jgi:hypothetical protein
MDQGIKCARMIAAIIFVMAACLIGQSAVAQRGNAIDTLAAQMNQALVLRAGQLRLGLHQATFRPGSSDRLGGY